MNERPITPGTERFTVDARFRANPDWATFASFDTNALNVIRLTQRTAEGHVREIFVFWCDEHKEWHTERDAESWHGYDAVQELTG